MAIDRDRGDAPDSAPTPTPARSIEGYDAPELAGAEQGHPADALPARGQQIRVHVRYREIVEASYQSAEALDAWAAAAPSLRAEWEAHRRRYPDREQPPSTTLPDGGWVGDGNRRLSPEQNAEAAKCAADLREEAIQRIGPAMDRIAAADPDRRFHLVKLKNLWNAEQYKGVNSQWRAPETGTRCEMQFHTSESLDAKELTHQAYERIRAAAALPTEERDFAEEQALEDFQSRANALLVTPPGADAIEDFREKPEKNID